MLILKNKYGNKTQLKSSKRWGAYIQIKQKLFPQKSLFNPLEKYGVLGMLTIQ